MPKIEIEKICSFDEIQTKIFSHFELDIQDEFESQFLNLSQLYIETDSDKLKKLKPSQFFRYVHIEKIEHIRWEIDYPFELKISLKNVSKTGEGVFDSSELKNVNEKLLAKHELPVEAGEIKKRVKLLFTTRKFRKCDLRIVRDEIIKNESKEFYNDVLITEHQYGKLFTLIEKFSGDTKYSLIIDKFLLTKKSAGNAPEWVKQNIK